MPTDDTSPAIVLQHPSARVRFDVRAEAARLVAAHRAVQQAQFDPPTPEQFATLDAADAIQRVMDVIGVEQFFRIARVVAAAREEQS